MTMRIAVLDDWQRAARQSADWRPLMLRADVEFFEQPFARRGRRGARARAVRHRVPRPHARAHAVPPSLVARFPRFEDVRAHRCGERALIDLAGMIGRGITVCYTEGGPGASSTAELALGLMLAAARHIPEGDAAVRAGRFQQGTQVGHVLAGKTLGLVGLGRIGGKMAAYGRALDMKVIAWSQNLTAETATAAGATRVEKGELFAAADVVSIHLVHSSADPRHRGRRRARRDEAGRDPRQHGARAAGRRAGADGGGACRAGSARRWMSSSRKPLPAGPPVHCARRMSC
jgi:hypothetical protein